MERRNTGDETDYHWAREFEFGDAHASTHRFVETALSRAPKEIACALAASLIVSPFVSIIDKSIVQDIFGSRRFSKAMGLTAADMFFTPKTFFGSKSFLLTFAVYSGTFAAANLSDLALDMNKSIDDENRKTIKISAASVANISLLAWRDSVFAREFSSGPPKPTSPRTIALFAVRDSFTMYSTFYLAPAAANYLHGNHGWNRNAAELSMALGIPVLTQFFTAPLHIHALDYYNKPAGSVTNTARLSVIRKEFNTVAFARGFRILPAFGIGSFSNNKFRELFVRQEDEDFLLHRRVSSFLQNRLSRSNRGGGIIARKITEKGLVGSPPPVVEDGGARPIRKGLV